MRILLVISEAPPVKSGIARVADRLTSGFRANGHDVDVLSLQDIPRWERGEVRLSSMPFKLNKLKERFRSYDLVHLHGPVPTFSDVFLLWGLRGLGADRPRLVYTYHAPIDLRTFPWLFLTWPYNIVQEWLARLADHVVVTSPSYAQRLGRSVPANRLSVVPWGVDYHHWMAPVKKPGKFTVVYLGQVRPYKGLPVLLKAAQGLSDVRIEVIGNGHYTDVCRRQAEELGLEDVTFLGALPDDQVVARVRQAHALVLPSVTRSEAFGIALLEGMAAGCVPIASQLPGVVDVVGMEGMTFPVGNAGALRETLTRLRDDVPLRRHLAGLAQAKAQLYSWERVLFGYERVFDRVMREHEPQTMPIPAPAFLLRAEEPSVELVNYMERNQRRSGGNWSWADGTARHGDSGELTSGVPAEATQQISDPGYLGD